MSTQDELAQQEAQDMDDAALEDAAFEEFANQLSGDAGGSGEKSGAEATDNSLETGDQDTDNSSDEQSESHATGDPSAHQDQTSEATAGNTSQDDTAESYEELKQRLARVEYENHSHRNRQSALARQTNEAKRELEEAQAELERLKQQGAAQAAPAQAPVESLEDAVNPDSDVDLKQFAEDFPDVFAAMNLVHREQMKQLNERWESQFSQVNQQLQQVAQPIEALQQREYQQAMQSELATLASVHPDYDSIQNSQEFWNWVDSQSEGVQALAGSSVAADNIALLDIYKTAVGMKMPSSASQVAANAPAAPQPRVRRTADANESLPRTSTTRVAAGVPDDEEAAFDYWAEQVNANRV